VHELNATQGSLLGFLCDGPKTGWDLLRQVEGGLDRFWNITSSHVYRELRALEERGLVKAGDPGARERRPFRISAAGRRAFRDWIAQPPAPEQIRFPLLVTLWFARYNDPGTLAAFVEESRQDHEQRLTLYEEAERALSADDDRMSVVRFGIGYERCVLAWLADTAEQISGERRGG
jgi:DNA-binding PadR family transcriptional regulator